MKNNSRNRKHLKHWKHSRIGKRRARSVLRQTIKVVAQGALIGTLLAPTAALPLQARLDQALAFTVAEWLPPVEHHREPRHPMGGIPQLASSSASGTTSATSMSFTIDSPTPMAEYFLMQRSLNTLKNHQRTARDIAVVVWGFDIQKHKSA